MQVPYYMFVHHRHKMETMTSVWFFPMVPGVVTALSAAIVAKVVDTERATQARCLFVLGLLSPCKHWFFA